MSKNHKPIDERELQQADATAYALGELSADEAAQFERRQAASGASTNQADSPLEQARRLGRLLRADHSDEVVGIDSTTAESQCCSVQIRESVLSALDSLETTSATKPNSQESNLSRRSRTRFWTWSLVASIAIAIGGFMFWFPPVQQVREASRRMDELQKQNAIAAHNYHDAFQRLPASRDENEESTETLADAVKAVSEIPSRVREKLTGSQESQKITEQGLVLGSKIETASSDEQGRRDSGDLSERNKPTAQLTVNVPDGGKLVFGGIVRRPNGSDGREPSDQFGSNNLTADELQMLIPPAPAFNYLGESARETRGETLLPTLANESRLMALAKSADPKRDEFDSSGDGTVKGFYRNDGVENFRRSEDREHNKRSKANEAYQAIPENPFWRPIGERAMSTFSVDVDTASYANVRRFLNDESLPPPDAVRLEEFINYFHYDYPQPEEGSPFAVDLKLFGCPWNAQHSLLRVGLHGREIESGKRPISNIVYLVDVSGSMSDENKLPLLKRGLAMMVDHLGESDTVSIVTYAGDAGVRLEPTNGANKKRILDAIDSLQSGGSTNGAAGIEVAYRLAQQNFVKGGANRVILMTDGDLNVGVTSDEALVNIIKEKAAGGVFLTVLGFGTGNLKDGKLEGLADNGNGIYGYIDSLGEAHKVLVEQMSGNLVTIAKDVKIQIEFNPAQVAGYRLIGYENRVMANQDFANDRKDAGEIGAGHTVTALYEIVPVGAMLDAVDPASSTLKYQTLGEATRSDTAQTKADIRLTDAAASGELARVALRFKTPEGTESRLIEFTAKSEVTSFSQADADCRFAAAVAAFGMRLRQSQFAGNITFDAIAEIASAALGPDTNGHRAEFADLVRRAKSLQGRSGE